ncbi:MAG: hypothetical protein IPM14_15985 [bacterium]|nr:hypothetical protein [bacterium]
MKQLLPVFFVSLILLFISQITSAQVYKVIESANDHIIVEFNFGSSYSVIDTIVEGKTFQKIKGVDHSIRRPGDPWVPEFKVLVGVPYECKPTVKILQNKQSTQKNKFIIPYPEEDPVFVKQDFDKINVEVYSKNELFPITSAGLEETYIFRYSNVLPISVSPYQFNPVTRDLVYNSFVSVRIDFNSAYIGNIISVDDAMTDEFLKSSTINYREAKSFAGKFISNDSPLIQEDYWHNPNKNYFKIYLKEKDVYRIRYSELVAAGVQLGNNTPIDKLEFFNDGLPVPIEIFDINSDQFFNAGDYLQFVGYPATATPYCKTNIYNLSNVYWFSYESDSSGVNYNLTPGWSDYTRTYFSNLTTLHFEKDTLYERLGYAPNQNRDFWFWDKASSRNQQVSYAFVDYFEEFANRNPDSAYVRLKVAMQGMSTSSLCQYDHKAYIIINGKEVGNIVWDGQNDIVFDKRFYVSPDSIPIYPGNEIRVEVRGDQYYCYR